MLDSRGCGYSSPRSQRSGAGVIGVGGHGPARALVPWAAPFDAALLASEAVGARLGGAEERGAPQHRLGRGRPPSWLSAGMLFPQSFPSPAASDGSAGRFAARPRRPGARPGRSRPSSWSSSTGASNAAAAPRTVTELVERWLEWRQQVRPISPVTVANREDRSSDRDPTATALTRLQLPAPDHRTTTGNGSRPQPDSRTRVRELVAHGRATGTRLHARDVAAAAAGLRPPRAATVGTRILRCHGRAADRPISHGSSPR
jgi:hypothetical protein